MGRVQRFILSRSGTRAGDLEAESRAWHIQCPVCGSSKSIWELGGVRYKAASQGKRVRGHCSTCGTRRWLHYLRIDPAASSEVAGPGADVDAIADGGYGAAVDHHAEAAPGVEGDHDSDRATGGGGPPADRSLGGNNRVLSPLSRNSSFLALGATASKRKVSVPLDTDLVAELEAGDEAPSS